MLSGDWGQLREKEGKRAGVGREGLGKEGGSHSTQALSPFVESSFGGLETRLGGNHRAGND